MLKTILIALLPLLLYFSYGSDLALTGSKSESREGNTGTLEKMIVASGSVVMDVNLSRFSRKGSGSSKPSVLQFNAERDSFFTIIVFNNELRSPLPSSMTIIPQDAASIPAKMKISSQGLYIEYLPIGGPYEMAVRDAKTGFTFFNIEGQLVDYNADEHLLTMNEGRLLISNEFATSLGRQSETGSIVGQISISARMRTIEVTRVVDGDVQSETLPADPNLGGVPGPDVIVGDVNGLASFGSDATYAGLAVGTDSCNAGAVDLNWFALPSNDHPVIPQNMYRMSGGPTNDQTIEQIGQSAVKHAFTALTQNLCGFGCNGVGGTRLGSGCSDPYSASLNAGPSLGSRAWINPFSGAYPRGDSADNPNNHTGHSHTGPAHRMLTLISDLNTTLNPGATYYAEGQYVTPHEYVWCQANPGQCNMYNNVSYRRYNVTGTTNFTFAAVGNTVRTRPAITAWTGSTIVNVEPAPGADGVAMVAYKVTNPSAGVWHYEYAVYNQNLDRAIQSFSILLGNGIVLSNFGFHMPPQQVGSTFDGTVGNTGFSSTPWAPVQTPSSVTWSSETLAQNPNANAIRWGSMYNFRFDSNRPPQTANATVGFFKTGAPVQVQVQGPTPAAASNVSVSGRVTNLTGQGVSGALVSLTDAGGNRRLAFTSPFGYYRFDNVATGATYTAAVISKRYTFNPQTVPINDNVTNLNFTALP